ncbi:MAG: hypothetical protein RLZZ450_5170 [Pseudomonadota bacterium]|jgi:hypothetical protein
MLRSWLATVSCALALSYSMRDAAASLARAEDRPAVAAAAPPVRLYGRNDPLLPIRLDAHASLTWDGNFGLGGRVDFPLISGTFRYSTRDELALSAGGDVTFLSTNGSQHVEVFPTVALQWSLAVDDRFYFFPEFGFSAHVNGSSWDGFYPALGFGARYYLRRSLSLQGRLGWPIALSAGATF